MNTLHTTIKPKTLVDQVEDKLLTYLRAQNYQVGDLIPHEMELATELGVARSVIREALSRLKMIGLIESRTRRGMVLKEPSLLGGMRRIIDPRILSDEALYDILGFRVALELGICHAIFLHITPKDIAELEVIVRRGESTEVNTYSTVSEYAFHSKLYEITGNRTISEFQSIIHPIMQFVKEKFKDYFAPISQELKEQGKIVTHKDLLDLIKQNDEEGFRQALEQHFAVYKIYMEKVSRRTQSNQTP